MTAGAGVAVQHGVRDGGPDLADEVVAQAADRGRPLRRLLHRQLDGGGQADDRGRVERARAHVALLEAAVQQRHDRHFPAEQQHARAVRAAELVPGERERVDPGRGEIHREDPDGLHGVGVDRHAVPVRDGGQLADRVDRAHLVVGPHHRYDGGRLGLGGERRGQGLGLDPAVAVDGQHLDLRALVLGEPPRGVEDGVVLDRGDEHAAAAVVGGRDAPSRGP